MKLEDIKTFLEENKDKEEVKQFVQGFKTISIDDVKTFVATEKDGKSWLDSEKDKHASKVRTTVEENYKKNELPKLVEARIKELYPEKDEKDLKLASLEQELNKIKADATRKELTNKALKIATEKKLPVDVLDFFIGEDEESTIKNIEKLETVLNKQIETAVNARLKDGDYTPPSGNNGDNGDYTLSSAIEAYYKK